MPKLVNVQVRYCEHCSGVIRRRRVGRSMRLTPPTDYAKRRYCGDRCKHLATRKRAAKKYCKHCGAWMPRKRFRGGLVESAANLRRRRFCDFSCAALYYETRRPSRSRSFETLARRYQVTV